MPPRPCRPVKKVTKSTQKQTAYAGAVAILGGTDLPASMEHLAKEAMHGPPHVLKVYTEGLRRLLQDSPSLLVCAPVEPDPEEEDELAAFRSSPVRHGGPPRHGQCSHAVL